MNLIEISIRRPVAVLSAVLIVVLLGYLALVTIPIQLTPDVRKPMVMVLTDWKGAAPAEVEREVLNRQEEVLKGLEGLERMESSARRGRSRIRLEFNITHDRDRAVLDVSNRLSQVANLPEEADEPRFRTRDTDDNPIAWFVVKPVPGNERAIDTYGDLIEDVIQDRLERIQGVALVNVYGGTERELLAIVEPQTLAHYRITIPEIVQALRRTNVSMSAGDLDEGKRRYTVRTERELNTIARIREVVLRTEIDRASGRIARLKLGDIAKIEFGYKKPIRYIRHLGENAVVVNAVRETGTNVKEVMRRIRVVVEELNAGPLPQSGLRFEQVYDETVYIDSAISLVTLNIWLGGGLAALVLLLFLRSFRATLVVSLAIPVSIIDASIVPVPKQRNSGDDNARIKEGETPEGWENQPAKRSQKDTSVRSSPWRCSAGRSTSYRWPAWRLPSAWWSMPRSSCWRTYSGCARPGFRGAMRRSKAPARSGARCSSRRPPRSRCSRPSLPWNSRSASFSATSRSPFRSRWCCR